MYLYYQDLRADCEPEFINEYDSIDKMMEKIKQQCDDGHNECPEFIPTYEEYIKEDFSQYSDDNEYSFHFPTIEEINNLVDDNCIFIIKDYVDGDEYGYCVTKNKIDRTDDY